jgi:nitroimidazol reductase NimA-like FMN-containing flavoprotein (pyridoxamine 5'-phosphate oxidase superfamily)
MDEEQMKDLMKRCSWGTLATVSKDGSPYAIEFSYFMMDGKICALINPNGTTAKNLENNPRACFKVCLCDNLCKKFEAISCFGEGSFEQDRGKICLAWNLLEQRLGLPSGTYSKFKKKYSDPDKSSPLLTISVDRMTGVANHTNRE